jgi:hypothetical protein
MLRFLSGLIIGVVIGSAVGAFAAVIAGDNGYLLGWTVTKDGEQICSDPFICTGINEIECD